MNQPAIISNVVTAVITAAVLGILAIIMGVFEAGSAAIDKEQIRAVLEEELQTDAGITYQARLVEVGGDIIVLETKILELRSDVEDLEDITFDLAGGG